MIIQKTERTTLDLNGSITARIKEVYLNGNYTGDIKSIAESIKGKLADAGINRDVHYIRNVLFRIRQKLKETTPDALTTPSETPVKPLTPEERSLIPSDNGYIDTERYAEDIIKAHAYNRTAPANAERVNVALTGLTGTGKTSLARYVSHRLKLPVYHATFNGETSTDNLFGTKELVNEGGISRVVWRDGIITQAVRNGGVLILDEFNAIHPSIAFNFFSLLGITREIVLYENGGERIKAHPDLLIIATWNEGNGYAGTNEVNTALLSRFSLKINVDYCTATEKKMVKKGLILNDNLLSFAKKQRDAYRLDKYSIPISTRDLITFTTLIKLYGDNKALDYFLNNFKTDDEKISIRSLYELEVKKADVSPEGTK